MDLEVLDRANKLSREYHRSQATAREDEKEKLIDKIKKTKEGEQEFKEFQEQIDFCMTLSDRTNELTKLHFQHEARMKELEELLEADELEPLDPLQKEAWELRVKLRSEKDN